MKIYHGEELMINCYNSFDPLKEVIIGKVDHSVINLCDSSQEKRLNYIFDKTEKELDNIQKVLENLKITVHRPNLINNVKIKTPFWNGSGIKIPLTPRDVFLVMGDTVVECSSWDSSCLFQTYYYRNALLNCLNRGAKWMQMPLPRHDYDGLELAYDDEVINQDPVLDGAAVIRYGKDIFFSGAGSHNELGEQWLMHNFPNYRYHKLDKKIFKGHLDSHLTILRPGLLLTYHKKDNLPNFFKNWDIIHVNPEHDQSISHKQTLIDDKIQDADFANTVLAVNCLSINPNTVMMFDHYKENIYLLEQFKKFKIDIIFVPFTYSHFFNQGMTCISFDLVRETNGCIDYTI